MWILLLIMLDLSGGTRTTTELEHYATQRECRGELMRISREMSQVYPGAHHNFFFVCRLKEAV